MSAGAYSSLKQYGKYLRSSRLPLSCPECRISLLPREFEKHCLSSHGLDPKRCCVWCFGLEEWDLGEKHLRANHLTSCFKKFIASNVTSGGSSCRSSLIKYHVILRRNSRPLPCPACKSRVSPGDFERHSFESHDLNFKRCCVWCSGAKRWKSGEKALNADHLISCFRNFLVRLNVPASADTTGGEGRESDEEEEEEEEAGRSRFQPRLLNSKPLCQTRDFFGHADFRAEMTPSEIHPLAFEQFAILNHRELVPERCRVDYFREENLNAAASYTRLFVETKDSHDWLHVMVKAVAFASFAEAVLADGSNTQLLPFSCWCDGGSEKETKFRQHRHLIAVCWPRGRFVKHVWPAVEPSSKPSDDFKAKAFKRIKSPMDLVNTMGSLSRRESSCNFTFG